MRKEIKVSGATVVVESKPWKHLIYFSTPEIRNGGQACWDTTAGDWKKVRGEFGFALKSGIKKEFGL